MPRGRRASSDDRDRTEGVESSSSHCTPAADLIGCTCNDTTRCPHFLRRGHYRPPPLRAACCAIRVHGRPSASSPAPRNALPGFETMERAPLTRRRPRRAACVRLNAREPGVPAHARIDAPQRNERRRLAPKKSSPEHHVVRSCPYVPESAAERDDDLRDRAATGVRCAGAASPCGEEEAIGGHRLYKRADMRMTMPRKPRWNHDARRDEVRPAEPSTRTSCRQQLPTAARPSPRARAGMRGSRACTWPRRSPRRSAPWARTCRLHQFLGNRVGLRHPPYEKSTARAALMAKSTGVSPRGTSSGTTGVSGTETGWMATSGRREHERRDRGRLRQEILPVVAPMRTPATLSALSTR